MDAVKRVIPGKSSQPVGSESHILQHLAVDLGHFSCSLRQFWSLLHLVQQVLVQECCRLARKEAMIKSIKRGNVLSIRKGNSMHLAAVEIANNKCANIPQLLRCVQTNSIDLLAKRAETLPLQIQH